MKSHARRVFTYKYRYNLRIMANVREMHDKIRDIMRSMRVTYFLSVVSALRNREGI